MAKRITEEELRLNITVAGNASGGLGKLNKKVELNRKTMNELRKEARLLKIQLDNVTPGTKDWDIFSKQLAAVNTRMKNLKVQTGSSINIITKMGKTGAGLVAVAGAAIAVGKKAIQVFAQGFGKIADFEQANADLSTILGKNVKDIKDLTDSAMSLGRTTEYTASQVTMLQTELAKLGFNESQIRSMQEPILHFATAVGTDLPSAASLAGAALRMFGLPASKTEDMLSVLAVSTNKSALSFSYLNEALSIVGPVANTFGFSIEDTTALLGALANAGFDASSAATATRNILLNLANSNGKLAKSLGGSVKTFPDLIEGLKMLDEKGIDLATTLELTDKRSVAAFNTFLSGADSAMELRESLDDVDGELQRIADERLNTVQGSIKLLQSAWEGFILQMSGSKGVIKSVIDFLTASVTKFTEWLFPSARVAGQADEYTKTFTSEYKLNGDEAAMKKMDEWEAAARAELDRAKQRAEDYNSMANRKALKAAEENLAALQTAATNVRASIKAAQEAAQAAADLNGKTMNELREEARLLKIQLNNVKSGTKDWDALSKRLAAVNKRMKDLSAQTPSGDDEDKNDNEKWSLDNDKSYLAAKKELTRQYIDGDIATQEQYEEKLYQLELSSLTARLALHKEKGADREKLEMQVQALTLAHRKKEAAAEENLESMRLDAMEEGSRKRIAIENRRYEQEKKKYQGNAAALELVEKKHSAALLQISVEAEQQQLEQMQQASQQAKVEIENKYLRRLSTVKMGSAEELAIRREMAQEIVKSDLSYLESTRKMLESVISTGKLAGIAIPSKQMQEFKAKLQEVIGKILQLQGELRTPGIWGGTGSGELFGVSQAQWDRLFNNLQTGKMSAEDLATSISAIGNAAQEGFDMASSAIDMINAKENASAEHAKKANEAKQDALQKRVDAGLMTQEQYDAAVERLQAEQDAADEELSLRQAERQKRFSIVQAIINTALGVTKTLADWGIPAGIAPAAIMSAMGAAQVALMAATPVTGYEAGGFVKARRDQDGRTFSAKFSPDARGFIATPTVLVGEAGGEYVIPAEGLKNPSVRSFVGAIETARINGRLKSLNLAAVNPMAAIGFSSGGHSSGRKTYGRQTSSGGAAGGQMELLLTKLLDRLDTPISAEVSMLGPKGLVKATEKYNRQRNRGKQW
jgi:TP901 family phage tail tape measure protein